MPWQQRATSDSGQVRELSPGVVEEESAVGVGVEPPGRATKASKVLLLPPTAFVCTERIFLSPSELGCGRRERERTRMREEQKQASAGRERGFPFNHSSVDAQVKQGRTEPRRAGIAELKPRAAGAGRLRYRWRAGCKVRVRKYYSATPVGAGPPSAVPRCRCLGRCLGGVCKVPLYIRYLQLGGSPTHGCRDPQKLSKL